MRLFFLTIGLSALVFSCKKDDLKTQAQAGTPHYYAYAGNLSGTGSSSLMLSDKSLIHCGTTATNKILVLKTTQEGTKVWQKELAADNNGQITSMVEMNTGEILACGSNDKGKLLIKLDANGNVIFSKTIQERSSGSKAYKIIKSADDNFYVLGTLPAANGGENSVVLKINNAGDSLWQGNATLGNAPGNDVPSTIIQCANSDIMVTGTTGNPPRAALVKINDNGMQQFSKSISTSNEIYDYAYPVHSIELQEGAFITCVYVEQPKKLCFLVKHNILGQESWRKDIPYNQQAPVKAMALYSNRDGGFTLAGSTGGNDMFAARYTALGGVMWQQTYKDERHRDVKNLVYDLSSNAFIITGNNGDTQLFTFKINGATGKPM